MVKNSPDCQYYDIMQHEAEIRKLRDEKYATWEWNFGYSPNYAFSRQERFPFGNVEIQMDIQGESVIKNIKIFGDFFSRKPVEELEQCLMGVRHEARAVADKLETIDVSDYIHGMTREEFLAILF